MNKYNESMTKLGAILQTQKATEEEVKEAYDFVALTPKDVLEMDEYIDPITPIIEIVSTEIAAQVDA